MDGIAKAAVDLLGETVFSRFQEGSDGSIPGFLREGLMQDPALHAAVLDYVRQRPLSREEQRGQKKCVEWLVRFSPAP